MKLSVHILTSGRADLLENCLKSVLTALPSESEVVVIANGADARTSQFLGRVSDRRVRWHEVAKESVSSARNRAFDLCQGEILHFLDDDVTVPAHLFRLVLSCFNKDPALVVLGGPNLTPPESPWPEKLFGATMASFVAAPMVCKRYQRLSGVERPATGHDLIFCNLAFRRDLIPGDLRFRNTLSSNQENLLLYESQARGLKAAYVGDAFVFHRRRSSFPRFAQQTASYGRGRFQQTLAAPLSLHPLFLLPVVGIALITGIVFSGSFFSWGLRLAGPYFGLCFLGALSSNPLRALGWKGVLGGLISIPTVHLSYGYGFWKGFLLCLKSEAVTFFKSSFSALEMELWDIIRFLKGKIAAKYHHYCPCCKSYAPIFEPFGFKKRPNAQCPTCGSLERHRLVWMYLKERTDLLQITSGPDQLLQKRRKRLLHVAPEPVIAKLFLQCSHLDYLSVDLYRHKAMVSMDITNLQFPDSTFDIIYASHVLEHIENDRKAMSELFRVLKPGGWAILQVPLKSGATIEDPTVTSESERAKMFGQPDHVRYYGNDYKDRLQGAGFEVTVDRYVRELAPHITQQYRLNKNEDIYLCRKELKQNPA